MRPEATGVLGSLTEKQNHSLSFLVEASGSQLRAVLWDIWQSLETFLVVTNGQGGCGLLASKG